jgi:prepilin-type N-terminal cleavage/methylation domain-containing protein
MHTREQQAGFSLVEVMVVTLLLLVAVGGLAGSVATSMRLSRTTREQALADEALRIQAGRMQSEAFAQVFRRYNGTDSDDPGLAGSAPGAAFEVDGLSPQEGDPDGVVGRIVFPVVEVGGVETLREDVEERQLGMLEGLDLNGDGDAQDDASNDYVLLPVRLIVEWKGAAGNAVRELDLLLAE